MVSINTFRALRPCPKRAAEIACPPYDVMNRQEARDLSQGRPHSFLHVTRADADFPDDVPETSPQVYQKGRENLVRFQEEGLLIQDPEPMLYIYQLTMEGRVQTGLVFTASVDEYLSGKIKKHERTLKEKELDRIRHFDVCNANTAPIYLTYYEVPEIREVMDAWIQGHEPIADFISIEGVRHTCWKMDEPEVISKLKALFEKVPALYIADGHHRCASAAETCLKRRREFPEAPEDAEFNRFLAVAFPDRDLCILAYHRVVKDLNGYRPEEFLQKLAGDFVIHPLKKEETPFAPQEKGHFGLYLDGKWWELEIQKEKIPSDPVESLDAALLQNFLLGPILGIEDPAKSERIDFIGGIRGLDELEKRCREDMTLAFSMFPTSMKELLAVADAGRMMPPKSTWFEPKLYSGLFIHPLS